jgi:hypothetical protein
VRPRRGWAGGETKGEVENLVGGTVALRGGTGDSKGGRHVQRQTAADAPVGNGIRTRRDRDCQRSTDGPEAGFLRPAAVRLTGGIE